MMDDIKKTLWATADKLRANMDAAEYKHLVLGLIFVKYTSDTFAARRAEVAARLVDPDDDYCYGEAAADDLAAELDPACLWFLAKGKDGKRARKGEVLFIDARKLATMISRVQCELTDEVIARVASTVAAWRGEAGAVEYADVAGYSRSVPLAEIAEHGHVLTPGRYVGAEAVADDDEGFDAKMQALTEKLGQQMAKGAELDAVIRAKLGGLGYAF